METGTTRDTDRSVGRRRVRPSRCRSVPRVSRGERACSCNPVQVLFFSWKPNAEWCLAEIWSAIKQYDTYPVHKFQWISWIFGSASNRQLALHCRFSLIGQEETYPDHALSWFFFQKLMNSSFLSNLKCWNLCQEKKSTFETYTCIYDIARRVEKVQKP